MVGVKEYMVRIIRKLIVNKMVKRWVRFTKENFLNFLDGRDVGSNGVMYKNDKNGLLPTLLRKMV